MSDTISGHRPEHPDGPADRPADRDWSKDRPEGRPEDRDRLGGAGAPAPPLDVAGAAAPTGAFAEPVRTGKPEGAAAAGQVAEAAEDGADPEAPDAAGPQRASAEPAAPAPLGVERVPTGDAQVDARLARLGDADHLPTDGHIAVYEDVHQGLRDALSALDASPAPPAYDHRS